MARRPGSCSPPSNSKRCCHCPRPHFELAVWSTGKVATDCHVKVGKALYSVPWRLIGPAGPCPHLRRHRADRAQRGRRGHPRHSSVGPGHRLRALPAGEDRLHPAQPRPGAARRPTEVGPACVAVIAEFMAINAIHRLRSRPRSPRVCARPSAIATGGSVRPGHRRRRPQLPHHQGHPRRRHRTRRHHRTRRLPGRRPICAARKRSTPHTGETA